MAWKPNYISVAQLTAYLRILDDDDDVEIGLYVDAVSRAIDRCCNRQFGLVAAPVERFYTARVDYERGRWVVDIDDLMSSVGLVVEVDGTAVTTYRLEPVNAAADGRPWESLSFDPESVALPTGADVEVGVTAPWGWSAVPGAVELAARLQGSRFNARRDSPYGVAGSPSDGSEMRLLSRLDPDVAVSLKDYRRTRSVL